jgi:hypothetical protein
MNSPLGDYLLLISGEKSHRVMHRRGYDILRVINQHLRANVARRNR